MDNLCHTLVGAALGEAGLARRKPLATATLLIGANLPDVDGFTYAFLDGPTSLAFRRGWTHGVLAMVILPVLLAAAMVGFDQMVRRRRPEKSRGQALRACTRRSSRLPARFRALLLPAFASVLSHPLLDFLNTYGVRFLSPFSERWFYGDTLFIVDPWVWIALALGITLSRVARRRSPARAARPAQSTFRWPGRGRMAQPGRSRRPHRDRRAVHTGVVERPSGARLSALRRLRPLHAS